MSRDIAFFPLFQIEKMVRYPRKKRPKIRNAVREAMDFNAGMEFFKQLETEKVLAYLKAMELKTLMEHPYFLAGAGVTALVALLMRWRLLLVILVTLTGFMYLLGYTLEKGTSLDGGLPTESLVVLVGGGAFIVFLAIYLLFIRSE